MCVFINITVCVFTALTYAATLFLCFFLWYFDIFILHFGVARIRDPNRIGKLDMNGVLNMRSTQSSFYFVIGRVSMYAEYRSS